MFDQFDADLEVATGTGHTKVMFTTSLFHIKEHQYNRNFSREILFITLLSA